MTSAIKPLKTRRAAKKRAAVAKPRAAAGPPPAAGPAQSVGRRARRSHTEETKREGARLGREVGPTKAAAQLDVAVSLVRNWMAAYPAGSSLSGPIAVDAEQRRRNAAAGAL